MKRFIKGALLLGALGAAFLLGQNTNDFDKWWRPENDALVAAPQHHKVLLENDEVRVLEVTVRPAFANRSTPTGIHVSCTTSPLPI